MALLWCCQVMHTSPVETRPCLRRAPVPVACTGTRRCVLVLIAALALCAWQWHPAPGHAAASPHVQWSATLQQSRPRAPPSHLEAHARPHGTPQSLVQWPTGSHASTSTQPPAANSRTPAAVAPTGAWGPGPIVTTVVFVGGVLLALVRGAAFRRPADSWAVLGVTGSAGRPLAAAPGSPPGLRKVCAYRRTDSLFGFCRTLRPTLLLPSPLHASVSRKSARTRPPVLVQRGALWTAPEPSHSDRCPRWQAAVQFQTFRSVGTPRPRIPTVSGKGVG